MDEQQEKEDCCSQRITIPSPSRPSKKKYSGNLKPVVTESDVAYALDKLENLVISFLTDFTNSQHVYDTRKIASSPLAFNIRRKFQLMVHLLKQFDTQIQSQLHHQVLNEILELIQNQRKGVDEPCKVPLTKVREVIAQFKAEVSPKANAPSPQPIQYRTLRLSKFILNVKKSLSRTPVLSRSPLPPQVHSVATGVPLIRKFPEDYENPSSPFQYDKSVSSPWPQQQQQQQVPQLQPIPAATRFPKTLKEFLGLTTESEKYLFEKILQRNSTFHQPLSFDDQNPTSLSMLTEKENSADYTNMLIRQKGRMESQDEKFTRPPTAVKKRKPFIWCGIGPQPPGLKNADEISSPQIPGYSFETEMANFIRGLDRNETIIPNNVSWDSHLRNADASLKRAEAQLDIQFNTKKPLGLDSCKISMLFDEAEAVKSRGRAQIRNTSNSGSAEGARGTTTPTMTEKSGKSIGSSNPAGKPQSNSCMPSRWNPTGLLGIGHDGRSKTATSASVLTRLPEITAEDDVVLFDHATGNPSIQIRPNPLDSPTSGAEPGINSFSSDSESEDDTEVIWNAKNEQ